MAAINDVIAELNAALADITPRINGLQDYAELNILPATLHEVREVLDRMQRRSRILISCVSDLQALISDGYPALPPELVDGNVYADLLRQKQEIEAALAKFTAGTEAVTGTITLT